MTSKQNPSLEDQLKMFQKKYYKENKKNIFFKNDQKFDCASKVTEKFTLKELINKSIYIDKEYNIIVSYPLIKTFIHPSIYPNFLDHIEKLTTFVLEKIPSYTIHIDLQSFTITAAERYSGLIKQFCSIYLQKTEYNDTLKNIYIHNPPTVIDIIRTMFSPFMSSSSKDKIIVLNN